MGEKVASNRLIMLPGTLTPVVKYDKIVLTVSHFFLPLEAILDAIYIYHLQKANGRTISSQYDT